MRKQLLYYAVRYKGEYARIHKALIHNEKWIDIEYDGNYITIVDELYPKVLKQLRYAPWVLFYDGDITLLKESMVAVIGSREMSSYGRCCCEELIKSLSQSYGIISGLAKGIDGCAHTLALQYKRKTIAVLGCGIDICYPKENLEIYIHIKKVGLLISEYPNQTKPLAHHFPWRNRIIACLCKDLVVVEAKQKSGTMITVNEALQLGKEVHCFCHRYFDRNGFGCNWLIAQGCNMIYCKNDIQEI